MGKIIQENPKLKTRNLDKKNVQAQEKEKQDLQMIKEKMANIKYKFIVISGKGGVGKSSVAVNFAASLAKKGNKVGILDADIHGPNVPKMLGVENEKPSGSNKDIVPINVSENLQAISTAFFLAAKEDAVIWRGPMKHNLLKQFLGKVKWGELDYLIVDLPPGTGDEALSITQLIENVSGALVVTTPQDVALLDSRKSITFCREMHVPLIGVIENMSGMICPYCHKKINLFKTGGGERIADEMKVPFIGRIPLDPQIVTSTDDGRPFVLNNPKSSTTNEFNNVASNWIKLLRNIPASDVNGKAGNLLFGNA